jgi:peptide deformylase
MPRLDIHVLGSPVLRQQTERVTQFTPELRRLADDMFETMHAAKGIGLAAPQVGRLERLTVVEVEDTRVALVNPEIVEREGVIRWEEGCLSIPEVYAEVQRSAHVVVRAQDLDGNAIEVVGDELLAVCLQHEIDHLHGKLFLDRLSLLRRRSALKAWEQEKAKYAGHLRVLPVGDLPPEREGAAATAAGDGDDSTAAG